MMGRLRSCGARGVIGDAAIRTARRGVKRMNFFVLQMNGEGWRSEFVLE
jgi:hypothetical protein